MAEITNTFLAGRMDKDLDERLIGEGIYRDALNIRVDIAEGANVGAASNSLGNTLVSNLASITGRTVAGCKTIGAVKYERDNLIYWLVASQWFDAIFEYNSITQNVTRVLQCNRTPSTTSTLNFDPQYLVTGINYINGFLYWTDNYNEPRKINIVRSKSYPVDYFMIKDDLKVILAPPLNSPKIKLYSDGTESNNLSNKFISFSYRYKYIDGQYSAMSPFSAVAFSANSSGFNYSEGNNASMLNNFNSVDVSVGSGGPNVTDIQLLFRDNRNLNIQIIETYNKAKLSIPNYNVTNFKFKNNKTYEVITSDQVTRLFDNVPLLAKAQDFVGDRLMYGNYTQFYDIKDASGDIKVDLSLDYISQSTVVNAPIQTFRSDRDYEVGIVYLDSYGRSSTVLTSSGNTVYIPPSKSITGNSLKLTIKNEAPSWASNYRIVIKQANNDYYNIFPLLFYSENTYKYFLINKSDIDKIKVGEYIIFKATGAAPTLSNKKYKILEIDIKPYGFFNSTSPGGVFFKITTDYALNSTLSQKSLIWDRGIGGGDTDRLLLKKISKPILSGAHFVGSHSRDVHYYGKSNKNALEITNGTTALRDVRFKVKVLPNNKFSYYYSAGPIHEGLTYGYEANVVVGSLTSISYNGGSIKFKFKSAPVDGDVWTINCRGVLPGGISKNTAVVPTRDVNLSIKKGTTISIGVVEDRFNTNINIGDQSFPPSDRDYDDLEEWWYESGACKKFSYIEHVHNVNIGATNVHFRRASFWGLAPGNNTDFDSNILTAGDINFAPIRMLISSSYKTNTKESSKDQPRFMVDIKIDQPYTTVVCETEAKESDIKLYHELSETYPIENGKHLVGWKYSSFTSPYWALGKTNLGIAVTSSTTADISHNFEAGQSVYVRSNNNSYIPSGTYNILSIHDKFNIVIDFPFPGAAPGVGGYVSYSIIDQNQLNYSTSPAVIKINNPNIINSDFNAWSFGNGLESNRILDDWNESTLDYSLRVNSTIDDYKRKTSENAICYSGIFGVNTGVNRLNEFNLSLANFKYLDKSFGSIQKLHARDTDLLVLQENKISSVLYGKNLLYDAIGGGQVASIPEVLGSQIAFPFENGISRNPESFAAWGEDIYFTDSRRGTVINIRGNQLSEINNGMQSYFRDLMIESPNFQKIGAYDPYNKNYVLSNNNISILACKHSLSRYSYKAPAIDSSGYAMTINQLFTINTQNSWEIQVIDNGFGTNWAWRSGDNLGTGNYDVKVTVSVNNTNNYRSLTYRVLFCGSEYEDFILTQGTTKEQKLTEIIYTNFTDQWG